MFPWNQITTETLVHLSLEEVVMKLRIDWEICESEIPYVSKHFLDLNYRLFPLKLMSAEIFIRKSTFDVVCVVVTRDESFSRVTSRY